jgi:hypothetical protein
LRVLGMFPEGGGWETGAYYYFTVSLALLPGMEGIGPCKRTALGYRPGSWEVLSTRARRRYHATMTMDIYSRLRVHRPDTM